MSPKMLLGFDAAWCLVWTLITAPVLIGVGALHLWVASALPGPLSLALLPLDYVLLCVGLCLMVWPLRAAFAPLRPGEYPFPAHAESWHWLVGFALQRVLYMPLWQPFMFTFATLRWLCLRALGAQVPLDLQTATDADVLDAGLHSFGSGCMLATGVTLAGHMVQNGRLRLGAIKLGTQVEVRMGATIGPDVTIGDYTVIGPESRIGLGVRLGNDVFVGVGCTLGYGVDVGDDVVIGHGVTMEGDVTIGDGAVVAPHTRVPKGTVIAPNTRYPEAK